MIKKAIIVLLLLAGGYGLYQTNPQFPNPFAEQASDTDRLLKLAFDTQQQDLQVNGSGTVIKLLKDDLKGSRHQRFIIKLANGQTLLVAHNIDLAPKISTLKVGDTINFFGEYEWTAKGGVVHWTHHDPRQHHPNGWLEHQGKRYQ